MGSMRGLGFGAHVGLEPTWVVGSMWSLGFGAHVVCGVYVGFRVWGPRGFGGHVGAGSMGDWGQVGFGEHAGPYGFWGQAGCVVDWSMRGWGQAGSGPMQGLGPGRVCSLKCLWLMWDGTVHRSPRARPAVHHIIWCLWST